MRFIGARVNICPAEASLSTESRLTQPCIDTLGIICQFGDNKVDLVHVDLSDDEVIDQLQ